MTTIIDRRLNSRDKALKNRQRFIKAHKKEIAKSVKEIVDQGNVVSSDKKNKVRVKVTSEPTFRTDSSTGDRKYVLPGNEKHMPGDRQQKPPAGSGEGGKEGSPDGEGEDDFEFILTEDEFLEFIFDELELPDLTKKQIRDVTQYESLNAGYRKDGNPAQLHIVKSLKNSIARRIGLKRPSLEEIQDLKALLQHGTSAWTQEEYDALVLEIEALEKKRNAIPWIDPFDIRYRNQVKIPKPQTKAVMVCIMDVSYSMQAEEKDISKRFFMLLHRFLKRKYKTVDVLFVSHHSTASEVSEEDFFYGKETGGTTVSTAIEKTNEILAARYPTNDWNIYCAQSSDGDNSGNDDTRLTHQMNNLLAIAQYFAYIEVYGSNLTPDMVMRTSSVWSAYEKLSEDHQNLSMRKVFGKDGIWPVFNDLFSKERNSK